VLPSVEQHCAPASVNRKLAAVTSFYEFHARHGVDVARLLVGMQPAGRRRGAATSYKPFLAHVANSASEPVCQALTDHSRRVREMAAKVGAKHLVGPATAAVARAARRSDFHGYASGCRARTGPPRGRRGPERGGARPPARRPGHQCQDRKPTIALIVLTPSTRFFRPLMMPAMSSDS
jgi:hypothetical protein